MIHSKARKVLPLALLTLVALGFSKAQAEETRVLSELFDADAELSLLDGESPKPGTVGMIRYAKFKMLGYEMWKSIKIKLDSFDLQNFQANLLPE